MTKPTSDDVLNISPPFINKIIHILKFVYVTQRMQFVDSG